jgi:hypothetical protein
MEEKKFRKLLKEKSPQRIIGMHTHWIIKLSDKQLEKCIKLKNA